MVYQTDSAYAEMSNSSKFHCEVKFWGIWECIIWVIGAKTCLKVLQSLELYIFFRMTSKILKYKDEL